MARSLPLSHRVRPVEKILLAVAFAWCLYRTTVALGILFYVQSMDSAGFVDLIMRAASGYGLVSPSYSSFYASLPLRLADPFCHASLENVFRDFSFTHWHPYYVVYALALPVRFGLSALSVAQFAIALSEIGVLFLILFWIRTRGLPVFLSYFFVLTLFVWMPWAQGAFGQFYFDRLLLVSISSMILMTHAYFGGEKRFAVPLVILGFFILSISERGTMMLGAFCFAYPILYRGRHILKDRRCWLIFFIGLIAIAWSIHFVGAMHDDGTASFYTLASVLDNISTFWRPDDFRFPENYKLLVVLAPYILLALFEWRMAVIGIGSIVPNFLVSIGGAERIGFHTHYHSTYLPFLMVAAAFGLVGAWRRFGKREWFTPAAGLVLCCVFFYNRHIDTAHPTVIFGYQKPSWVYHTAAIVPHLASSPYPDLTAMGDEMRAVVAGLPRGAAVTTPEPFMPALVMAGHEFDILPVGLHQNPYVITTGSSEDGNGPPDALFYFIDAQAQAQEQACLSRMLSAEFVRLGVHPLRGNRSASVWRRQALDAPSR